MGRDLVAESFEALWGEVQYHLPMAHLDAVRFFGEMSMDEMSLRRIYYKARAGHHEHDGDILDMDDETVTRNAVEEFDDAVFYFAVLRARRYRRMRQATAF